jgi:hypothetical protein
MNLRIVHISFDLHNSLKKFTQEMLENEDQHWRRYPPLPPSNNDVENQQVVVLNRIDAGEEADGGYDNLVDAGNNRDNVNARYIPIHLRSPSSSGSRKEGNTVANVSTPPTMTRPAEVLDYSSLNASGILKLGGRVEYVLTFNILCYISAKDLSQLRRSSVFFNQLISKSVILWKEIYQKDFLSNDVLTSSNHIGDDRIDRNNSGRRPHPLSLSARLFHGRNTAITTPNKDSAPVVTMSFYIARYQDYRRRVERSLEDKKNLDLDMIRLDRLQVVEMIIDIIHVRLFVPLLLGCLFLSIVLYCQKIDGEIAIPIWACAIPLAVCFGYVFVCIAVMKYLKNKQYSSTSLLKGLYNYMKGPAVAFYQEILSESNQLLWICIGIIVLMILQLAMIVVKLSSNVPYSFRHRFNWGIVFIPIWIFFVLFCISPFTKFKMDTSIFAFCFNLIWIPLAIFFICLTVKLDDKKESDKMRIGLILIPFYIIEGSVLVSSLMVLLSGIHRYLTHLFCIPSIIHVYFQVSSGIFREN